VAASHVWRAVRRVSTLGASRMGSPKRAYSTNRQSVELQFGYKTIVGGAVNQCCCAGPIAIAVQLDMEDKLGSRRMPAVT
jgi:hypothetical protein